jgi:hypothetical protein
MASRTVKVLDPIASHEHKAVNLDHDVVALEYTCLLTRKMLGLKCSRVFISGVTASGCGKVHSKIP